MKKLLLIALLALAPIAQAADRFMAWGISTDQTAMFTPDLQNTRFYLRTVKLEGTTVLSLAFANNEDYDEQYSKRFLSLEVWPTAGSTTDGWNVEHIEFRRSLTSKSMAFYQVKMPDRYAEKASEGGTLSVRLTAYDGSTMDMVFSLSGFKEAYNHIN